MENRIGRLLGLLAGAVLSAGLAQASLPTSSLNKTRLGTACTGASNSDTALQCWLAHNPNVEQAMVYWGPSGQQAFAHWPAALQNQMYGYFDQMVGWYNAGWPPEPQPLLFPTPLPVEGPDPIQKQRYLTVAMGTQVYLAQVAAILAGELTAQFSWSIATYPLSDLKLLLDQSVDFQLLSPPDATYTGYYGNEFVATPANPSYVALFFKVRHLIGSNAADTVGLLVDWEHRLFHMFTNGALPTDLWYTYFWGPDAPPIPDSYVVNGTTYTGPDAVPHYDFQHFTAGCWGTQSFMSSMLKIMNIPVRRTAIVCLHATPVFPTVGLALTHGDDPYQPLGLVTPYPGLAAPSGSDYLVSLAEYNNLFPADQSLASCQANVGIQSVRVGVAYASDYLMSAYCQDLASNATEADGQVYALLHAFYTVQQLQSMQLWQTLEFKRIVTNWCVTHP